MANSTNKVPADQVTSELKPLTSGLVRNQKNRDTPVFQARDNGMFGTITPFPDMVEEDDELLPLNSSVPLRLGFIPGRRVPKPRPIQNDKRRDFLAGNTRAPNTRPGLPGAGGKNGSLGNKKKPFRGQRSDPRNTIGQQQSDSQDDSSKQTDASHYSTRLECHQYGTDYKSRIERQCCLKSAKCFQNFPDDLDEFKGHKPGDNFDPATACRHIDNALLCMSRVFRREECRATADVVNRNLRDELTSVNNIYKEHCHGKPKPPLSTPGPRVTHSPGGQQGQGDGGPPMTTLIAAGVGGFLAVLLIILIVVLLKKKRRPKDGRSDEKVMFENNSTNSSRYKSFTRKNSEVYAEIDDRAITIANLDNNNLSVLSNSNSSLDTRPLPSAPGIEDKTGYLTPKSSRQRITEELGYDELEHAPVETGSPSYDKLKLETPNEITGDGDYEEHEVAVVSEDGDCEYITPTTENGPKVNNKLEDNYHMYFVLEK